MQDSLDDSSDDNWINNRIREFDFQMESRGPKLPPMDMHGRLEYAITGRREERFEKMKGLE